MSKGNKNHFMHSWIYEYSIRIYTFKY